MILRDGTEVRKLRDRYNTGYAGFGYGGEYLYVAMLVDCFDPPCYLIRADSFTEAYETAVECLSETVEMDFPPVETLPPDAFEAFMEEHALTLSPSGRVISTDDDIRLYRIPTKNTPNHDY